MTRIRTATAVATTVCAAVALTVTAMAPATAVNGDRPKNVASVRADKQVLLSPDGTTVTVVERIECDPGWVPAELDAQVSQGDAVAGDYAIPTIPCDGHFHPVTMALPVGAGTFRPGSVVISSQFLVTNEVSGDSAGAHDTRTGRLRPAH